MKKVFLITMCAVLLLGSAVSVSAASVDDGIIMVAEMKDSKYFGAEISEGITKYVAANGSGVVFYDLTDDKKMNVCDLVRLEKTSADISENGQFGSEDGAYLRNLILDNIK